MRHQVQKGFYRIFVGIPQHQKGPLVYVPSARNIISSYDVSLNESILVRYNIRHNRMQKRWLCVRMCHTYRVIHPRGGKLTI